MAVAEVQLHAFLTLALAEDGWSISCPRCSTPKGMRPQYPLNSKFWARKPVLDILEKRNIYCPCWELKRNSCHPAYTVSHYSDYTTLHYTTLHYSTLHYSTLHYTIHYTTLHYTTLHYTTLHYTTLHYTTPSPSE